MPFCELLDRFWLSLALPGAPYGTPNCPQGGDGIRVFSPMGRKWLPSDPQEAPKGAKSNQNDSQSAPKGSKWELKVTNVGGKNLKKC